MATQAELDGLKAMRARGVLEEQVEGKRVRYFSLDELQRAIDTTQAELDSATGTVPTRRIKIYSTKDL